MTIAEDLKREMQETKDGVAAVAVRLQELIDKLEEDPGLSAAAQEVISEMDALQTKLAEMATPTPPPPPVE